MNDFTRGEAPAGAPRVVVIASRNPDKVREIREIAADLPFEIRGAEDYDGLPEVIEDGTTLQGNATRKALATAAFTGEIAVADDTVLQVDALDGLPGLFAARFAEPVHGGKVRYADNTALLLDLLRDVDDSDRGAAFVTAVSWIDPRPALLAGEPLDPPAGDPSSPDLPPQAGWRWLHNPWRPRAQFRDPVAERDYWVELSGHDRAWEQFIAQGDWPAVAPGVDRARVAELFRALAGSARDQARDPRVPAGAIRIPDTRIWTVQGRREGERIHPAHYQPSGLPASAPGAGLGFDFWLELTARGKVTGRIARTPRGAGGFGYDPVFEPEDLDLRLAQLAPARKNALSHRGRSLRRLFDAAGRVYRP